MNVTCYWYHTLKYKSHPAIDLFLLRSSEKSMEQKETAEQELLMKGPGTFPLERLLAIFQCLTSVVESSLGEDQQINEGLGAGNGDSGLMSDVLLQLSSLCNANFISKGGSCPLEGSTRYRATISEDLALKVSYEICFLEHFHYFFQLSQNQALFIIFTFLFINLPCLNIDR